MSEIRCTMCGVQKPEDEFRLYPSGKRRRPFCKECESIETRRRYLERLRGDDKLTDCMADELKQINDLYDQRIAAGLNTFGKRRKKAKSSDYVTKQLSELLGDALVDDMPD